MMTDDLEERDTERTTPDHPPEWPKNDPVPDGGVPLPDGVQPNPPVEEQA
jgi:hypothetical protein